MDEFNNYIVNELENYVLNNYPVVSKLKDELISSKAIFVQMSGSGSSVYAIYDSNTYANEMFKKFSKKYYSFIYEPLNSDI